VLGREGVGMVRGRKEGREERKEGDRKRFGERLRARRRGGRGDD